MKIEFIKRGAETRLILIFAGWSTDTRYYNDCVADGWDTAVVSDYRQLTMPDLPRQYTTIYLFAYSLGVAVASLCNIRAAVRVAICGSPKPVSDHYGIPEAIFKGTLEGLNERSLMKFHLRMVGDKAIYESIKGRFPLKPDIEKLKRELQTIKEWSANIPPKDIKFDRVYLAEEDRIFPYGNLHSFWKGNAASQVVILKTSHAVDVASVVKDCIPDTSAIGEGFASAEETYNENAVVQKDICNRICRILEKRLPELCGRKISLLEIGVGRGLLTEEWRKCLIPEKATYIDLTHMPHFGISSEERYLITDAEIWLENSDETFDIILCASTIQWFADPVKFLKTIKTHLKPGGIGIVSTFISGNLVQLDGIRPCPLIYHSEQDYSSSDVAETECWEQTLRFESVKDLIMHLRLTGVIPIRDTTAYMKNGSPTPKNRLSGLPKELTYRPMIVVIKN